MLLYRLIPGHSDLCVSDWVYPKIPHSRLNDEDASTERICVAEDPDNCLTSMGFSYLCLEAFQKILPNPEENKGWEDIWTKLRFPFTVLMFQIDENDPALVHPEELKNLVPDAKWTREFWITKPMQPAGIEHLWLVDACTDEVMVTESDKHYACILKVTDSYWCRNEKPISRFFADEVKNIIIRELQDKR